MALQRGLRAPGALAPSVVTPSFITYSKDETGKITLELTERQQMLVLKLHILFDDRTPNDDTADEAEIMNTISEILTVYQEADRIKQEYIYDANGNRLEKELTLVRTFSELSAYYTNTEWLMVDKNWVYRYDENGNQTEKGNRINIGDTQYTAGTPELQPYLAGMADGITEFTYAQSGDDVKYWLYDYDLLNRLEAVYKNGEVITRYGYGPDNLRTWKRSYGNSEQPELKHEVFEGNDLIFEKNITTGQARSYVYGMGKHLVRIEGVIGDTTATKYYYITDHLGSVRAVTDENRNVIWKTEYDPFGNILIDDPTEGYTEFENEYIFGGKRYEEDIELYYFNSRYYDQTTGRFISEDLIRDGLNWYVYVGNNPLVFVDPTGMLLNEFQMFANEISLMIQAAIPGAAAVAAGLAVEPSQLGKLALVAGTAAVAVIADGILIGDAIDVNKELKTAEAESNRLEEKLNKMLPDGYEYKDGNYYNEQGQIVSTEEVLSAAIEKNGNEQQVGTALPEGYYKDSNGKVYDSTGKLVGDQNDAWNEFKTKSLHGSGPAPGYIEVSGNYTSFNLVKNFQGKGTDFVFDPVTKRFVMGNNPAGHVGIARLMGIGVNQENRIVGGRIFRIDGTLITNEFSGHYGDQWTPEIREQFDNFMKNFGIDQIHSPTY